MAKARFWVLGVVLGTFARHVLLLRYGPERWPMLALPLRSGQGIWSDRIQVRVLSIAGRHSAQARAFERPFRLEIPCLEKIQPWAAILR